MKPNSYYTELSTIVIGILSRIRLSDQLTGILSIDLDEDLHREAFLIFNEGDQKIT